MDKSLARLRELVFKINSGETVKTLDLIEAFQCVQDVIDELRAKLKECESA